MRFRTLCVMIIALALLPQLAAANDRYALVIGNGKYKNVDPLPNPPNDVKLVAGALEKVGFEVTLLVDADRRAMDRAAKQFARTLDDAGKNAVGVFYFAGHGVSYDGQNWLLPVGSEITEAADIEYETISANKVLRLMEGARNATDIVILDACRNSPFRSFSLSGTRAVSRGMARMDAPVGSFIAYSTAPGAVAYDGDGNYSPFAEAFAAEVGTPGNSISDMMIEVRKKVKASTSKLGSSPQTPWDSSSLTGRFSFVPGERPAPTPGPSIVPVNPEPRPTVSADDKLWASIENSTDAAEFEYYLKRFPNGNHAELARIRADRLAKKAVAKVDKPAPKPAVQDEVGGGDNSEAAKLCRQFADGDAAMYMDCMDEYQATLDGPGFDDFSNDNVYNPPRGVGGGGGMQGGTWYDDQFNQWQVSIAGATVTASTFVVGVGPVQLRGQLQGTNMSYGIFDGNGMQFGYGQGFMPDPTHVNYTSYWANGAFMGSGQFHINHPPN